MTVIRRMAVLLLVVAFALSSVIGHGHASVQDDVMSIAPAIAAHGHHHGGMDKTHPVPAQERSDHSSADDKTCCAMGGCGMTVDLVRDLSSTMSEPVVMALLPVNLGSTAPALEGPPPRSIG